jgi:hypothetical protein
VLALDTANLNAQLLRARALARRGEQRRRAEEEQRRRSEAAAQAERLQREAPARAHLVQARAHLARHETDEALRMLDAVQAHLAAVPSDEILREAEALRATVDQSAASRKLAAEARDALVRNDLSLADERVQAALALDADNLSLIDLHEKIQSAIVEQARLEARDLSARSAIDAARRLAADGKLPQAIARLERGDVRHPLVSETLESLRRDLAVQEQQHRAEEQERSADTHEVEAESAPHDVETPAEDVRPEPAQPQSDRADTQVEPTPLLNVRWIRRLLNR